MCDCFRLVNEAFEREGENTRLSAALSLRSGAERPVIQTEKRDPKNRRRPGVLVADFCPFCGQRYAALEGER
jgi:hypothetical protein